MAYSQAWNESLPAGSEAASTLDTIIQQLKEDLRERLEDAFPDWTDDATDPKRVVAHSGTLANRPAVADANAGELYVATDTGGLFRFDGTQWVGGDQASVIYAIYDDLQAGGAKVTAEAGVDQIVCVNISGTTNAFGVLTFDIGELSLVTPGLDLTKANVSVSVGEGYGTVFARTSVSTGGGPSTVSVFFYDYTGTAYGSQTVQANLVFFLSE